MWVVSSVKKDCSIWFSIPFQRIYNAIILLMRFSCRKMRLMQSPKTEVSMPNLLYAVACFYCFCPIPYWDTTSNRHLFFIFFQLKLFCSVPHLSSFKWALSSILFWSQIIAKECGFKIREAFVGTLQNG